jgi:hypothetical protein
MEIKDHAKNTDTWLRGFFILVFGVIFYFLYILIWLLVIFQFVTKVITGELNSNLEQFSTKLTSYAMQILNYITYQSEERPFPFSPFPEENPASQRPDAVEKTPKRVTRKKKTSSKKADN